MSAVIVRSPQPDEMERVQALMVRVIELDYGYPYQSRFHTDVDDPTAYYLDRPRHTLLVAIDPTLTEIVGIGGIRVLAITAPPHPRSILARYDPERTAELTRVFVAPEHRRRGIGQALVAALRRWATATGGFDVIGLHSRTAVEFWRSFHDIYEVLDTRDGSGGPSGGQVYFEFAL